MGGRMGHLDSYLGSGGERTSDYSTINKLDSDVEFITSSSNKTAAAPIYSNTPNRTYVLVNSKGRITSITKYENHREVYSIHPGHYGEGGGMHVHNTREGKRVVIKTTKEHIALYNRVVKAHNEFKNKGR